MGWFFKRKSIAIEREDNNNACQEKCCDNQLDESSSQVLGDRSNERQKSLELWSQARKARCDQEQQERGGGTTQMTHELVVNKSVGGTAIVNRKYVVLKTLGQGTYGKVKLCLNIKEYSLYALKIASKQQIIQSMQRHLSRQRLVGMQFQRSASSSQADNFRQARQQLLRGSLPRRSINSLPPSGEPSPTNPSNFKVEDMVKEIAILKNLDHPNIVKLIEVIDDPNTDHLLMIMEYVEGGTLEPPVLLDDPPSTNAAPYCTCQKWQPVSESQTRRYVQDVILGLEYLHFNNIIHGDLKPQNLLISKTGRVKLADFGSAVMFSDPTPSGRGSNFGTPAFRAPETLLSGYKLSPELDMWALGVCVYQWIFGELPFKGFTPALVYEAIRNQQFEIPAGTQQKNPSGNMKIKISVELADFMARLLDKDVTKRLTLHEALRHPWVTQQGTSPLLLNGNAQHVPVTSCQQCVHAQHMSSGSCVSSVEDLHNATNVQNAQNVTRNQLRYVQNVVCQQEQQNVLHAQNVVWRQCSEDQQLQQQELLQQQQQQQQQMNQIFSNQKHEQFQELQNQDQHSTNQTSSEDTISPLLHQQQFQQQQQLQTQGQQIEQHAQHVHNAPCTLVQNQQQQQQQQHTLQSQQNELNAEYVHNVSCALAQKQQQQQQLQREVHVENVPNVSCALVEKQQQLQLKTLWTQRQHHKRLRVGDRLTQEDVERAIQTQEGSSKLLTVMNTIFRECTYNDGETLFQKGQLQDRIFLIANGEVLLVDQNFESTAASSGNRSSFEDQKLNQNTNLNQCLNQNSNPSQISGLLQEGYSLISDQMKDDMDDGASDFLEEVGVDVEVDVQDCYVPNVGALVQEQLNNSNDNNYSQIFNYNNNFWDHILEIRGPGEGLGLCQANFFQNQQAQNMLNKSNKDRLQLVWPFSGQAQGAVTCIEAKMEDVLQLSRQCEEFQWEISNLAWSQQTDLMVAEAMRYLRVKVDAIPD